MAVWVVGAGGLLGSSVTGALAARGTPLFLPPGSRLPWGSAPALSAAFRAQLSVLLRPAPGRAQEAWAVLWCAGAAVVASGESAVSADRTSFELFLAALESALAESPSSTRSGCLLLASSAGGAWGGHQGLPITEATPSCPISEYGRAHLAREDTLARFVRQHPGLRAAVVRLSNLYGPGQRLDKPQGLVSHMARSLVHRRPVHIYVPLDTVRDYLYAADAGVGMADVLDQLRRQEAGTEPVLKLLASEQETSVGELISIFRRVTRRQVAVTAGMSAIGRLQPLRLRFRSHFWPGVGRRPPTPLPEGIVQVYRYHLEQFTKGALPPP
jgi:UDP-glucose 4-epimerase